MEFVYLGLKDKIIDICRGEPRRAKKFKARKILANKSNESFSTNFSIMKQEREVLMAAIK